MILGPLSKEEVTEKTSKDLKTINEFMQRLYKSHEEMSFAELLHKLNLSKDEYIHAIRSSIKRPQPFLKRRIMEVGISNYNKDILHLMESNIDIQFVLEEYGLATYVINYIGKVDARMCQMLRDAAAENEDGNVSITNKFRKIANIFLNSNLMSAQEAAYHVLSLRL